MTLRTLFSQLSVEPQLLLLFFGIIPFTALLAGILGKGEGHVSPWKELYALLIYLVCVPGVFAVALSVYLFLFERRRILDTDVYIQIVPVLSMILTLFFIRRNIDFDNIPGFGRISGLMTLIAATLIAMWLIDKTHIIAFVNIPVHYLLVIFAGLFMAIRFGMGALFR
jgi:hypothetical protein